MLTVLLLCMSALASGQILVPNSSTTLFGGTPQTLEWDNNNTINLKLELNINGTWNDDDDNHFLSIIVDSHINSYDWNVPLYISQYWNSIARLKLTQLSDNRVFYSDNFTIAGITVDNIDTLVYSDSSLNISWTSNLDQPYNIYLYDNYTTYYNIEPYYRSPIYTIIRGVVYQNYSWYIINGINFTNVRLAVISNDGITVGLSNTFSIMYPPTASPTYSPTVTPTYNPTLLPTTAIPTQHPSCFPTTSDPTFSPTLMPTGSPTTSWPSISPTGSPTTSWPTASPTGSPTTSWPSISPTGSPTTSWPTASPTWSPTTGWPSISPTGSPTTSWPTTSPTGYPTTSWPTASPTGSPTMSWPTASPTGSPTMSWPTTSPTGSPTTANPTAYPTVHPSCAPTKFPTTTTTTTTQTNILLLNIENDSDNTYHFNWWMLMLIILGGILLLCLIITIIKVYCCNKEKDNKITPATPPPTPPVIEHIDYNISRNNQDNPRCHVNQMYNTTEIIHRINPMYNDGENAIELSENTYDDALNIPGRADNSTCETNSLIAINFLILRINAEILDEKLLKSIFFTSMLFLLKFFVFVDNNQILLHQYIRKEFKIFNMRKTRKINYILLIKILLRKWFYHTKTKRTSFIRKFFFNPETHHRKTWSFSLNSLSRRMAKNTTFNFIPFS